MWQAAWWMLRAAGFLLRTGQAVRSAAPVMAASARLASPSSASSVVLAAHWVWTEAAVVLEFARSTLYRCVRAMQAVAKVLLAMAMAVNRHRVSLFLQAQRTARSTLPQRALQAFSRQADETAARDEDEASGLGEVALGSEEGEEEEEILPLVGSRITPLNELDELISADGEGTA